MMKKLLYVAAIAVLSTSCSVDNLQDENSINLNDLNSKASSILYCTYADIVTENGEVRGNLESFVDHNEGLVTVRMTTYDWKIRESKLYFGPDENVLVANAGLFDLGKYGFEETFDGDVYVAEYNFSLSNVKDDFALMAKLIISNDNGKDLVWAEGSEIAGKDGGFYIENALANCLEK